MTIFPFARLAVATLLSFTSASERFRLGSTGATLVPSVMRAMGCAFAAASMKSFVNSA